MTTLTSIQLNPLRTGCQYLLANPQRIHAAVMGTVPPDAGRVLWRLETEGPRATLLVQTPETPVVEHIVGQAGWPDSAQEVRQMDLDPLLEALEVGQRYAFRLRANTVRSERVPDKRGRLVGLVSAGDRLAWMGERCDGSHGFASDNFRMADAGSGVSFTKAGTTVQLSVATFEGVLEVSDAELLADVVRRGIGRAKAYGCGMLTLAKV